MTSNGRLRATRAALGLLTALTLGGAAGSTAAAQPPESKLCCFSNWRYAGGCVVQISADQSCGDVLSILNNPMSNASGYCGDTDVRGGWVAIDCQRPSGGANAGTPTRMRAEEPPVELAPTERNAPSGVSQPGPGVRAQQPTYLTPVEPHALTPRQPGDTVLGPTSFPGW